MAQRVIQRLVDDITGKEIPEGHGETITFAVNGVQYEIDLDDKGAAKFHSTLQYYIDHARKAGRTNVSPIRGRTRKSTRDVDPAAVRAWAESNGISVNARGRIKSEVIEKYRAAMG